MPPTAIDGGGAHHRGVDVAVLAASMSTLPALVTVLSCDVGVGAGEDDVVRVGAGAADRRRRRRRAKPAASEAAAETALIVASSVALIVMPPRRGVDAEVRRRRADEPSAFWM